MQRGYVELEQRLKDASAERDNLFRFNQEKEELRQRNQALGADLAAARKRYRRWGGDGSHVWV